MRRHGYFIEKRKAHAHTSSIFSTNFHISTLPASITSSCLLKLHCSTLPLKSIFWSVSVSMEPSTHLMSRRKWYITIDFITDDDNNFFFRAEDNVVTKGVGIMLEEGRL